MKRIIAIALAFAALAFAAGYVVGSGTAYRSQDAVVTDEKTASEYGKALAQAAFPEESMDEYTLWAAYYNDAACVWAVSFISDDMTVVRVEFLATDMRLLSSSRIIQETAYPAL